MKTCELQDVLESTMTDLNGEGVTWHYDGTERDSRQPILVGVRISVAAYFDPREIELNNTAPQFLDLLQDRMAQRLLEAAHTLVTNSRRETIDKAIEAMRGTTNDDGGQTHD